MLASLTDVALEHPCTGVVLPDQGGATRPRQIRAVPTVGGSGHAVLVVEDVVQRLSVP